jgi:COMPASS component SWD2
MGKEPV